MEKDPTRKKILVTFMYTRTLRKIQKPIWIYRSEAFEKRFVVSIRDFFFSNVFSFEIDHNIIIIIVMIMIINIKYS